MSVGFGKTARKERLKRGRKLTRESIELGGKEAEGFYASPERQHHK